MSGSAAQNAGKGPSKKELNKLARKEKKNAPKGDSQVGVGEKSLPLSVVFCKAASPELTRAVELYLGDIPLVNYCINKSPDAHMPMLISNDGLNSGSVSGDTNISRFLVRNSTSEAAAALYGSNSKWFASQIDQWLDVYQMALSSAPFKSSLATLLDNHLTDKTYLVGNTLTLADIAMWITIKKDYSIGSDAQKELPNLYRWVLLVDSLMPVQKPFTVTFSPAAAAAAAAAFGSSKKCAMDAVGGTAAKSKDGKSSNGVTTGADKKKDAATEEGSGGCPPLEGAIDGQVVTRFPPEPSGYLHIGHAKAVLLNQYYAQRYNGKLLVRFDDTNPSKEKEEFQQNIILDLKTLGVIPYKVSHSSDHFATCEKMARKLISDGKAYMDDTDQETMQAERMEKKESKHRNTTAEENLKLFEQLLLGAEIARPYCLRAKMDMTSLNGTMRDPVLYRYNDMPHHRTGTKHKAYPTYDFACPLIDSIEGVTHALRTTEYNDRDEQYHWLQEAMGIRFVHIHAFGKMNFIHTVLSKRKLTWFVQQNLVEGWFDPRFPTIQGCVRRGMNVAALKNFIIGQGASRRVITMEWDKFWAENKKVLEEAAPRYMGVTSKDAVQLTILNVADEITAHSVQIHPQNPAHGMRVMRRYKRVFVDQADAATYKEGEDVTFLRWGNIKITKIDRDGDKVVAMEGEYDASATNFSKTKKVTWIAAIPDLVPCQIFEFDHLITKAKLLDEDKFQDYVNPVTKIESAALCDPCLRTVAAGDVIQLERKGFFRCDRPYGGCPEKPAVLFLIPDGKVKAGSTTANAAAIADAAGKSKKKK